MEYLPTLQSGIDPLKPSLFELLSESQLSALLPPTLRYLLVLATQRHPRYLLRLLNSYHELHALVFLALEHHYLTTYSASFTEHFYSLKRERVLRISGGEVPRAQLGASEYVRDVVKLSRRDIWKNLAVLVGLPYLKRKLDEAYEIHVPAREAMMLGPTQEDTLDEHASLRERTRYIWKWFLRKVYPGVNAAYYFSMLAFNLAYLFDASKYHSPWLWLVNTRMRRMGAADHRAIEEAALARTAALARGAGIRPGQTRSLFSPRVMAQTVVPRVLSSLSYLLPASIFALKFLEWWHASDFARQLSRKATEGLVLPPPIVSGLGRLQKAAEVRETKGLDEKSGTQFNAETPRPRNTVKPPISASTHLPIFTVPPPSAATASLCPICLHPIITASASPYGYVFCYTCIHRWVEGTHDRQVAFMEGRSAEHEAWAEDGATDVAAEQEDEGYAGEEGREKGSREGLWESGAGRCAVTGKKILGGTEGLRRVVV